MKLLELSLRDSTQTLTCFGDHLASLFRDERPLKKLSLVRVFEVFLMSRSCALVGDQVVLTVWTLIHRHQLLQVVGHMSEINLFDSLPGPCLDRALHLRR